jgi:hypothetical protein
MYTGRAVETAGGITSFLRLCNATDFGPGIAVSIERFWDTGAAEVGMGVENAAVSVMVELV